MRPNRDPSQYGNSKGVSTQHYLIKMVDRILSILDTNNQQEKHAVIVKLVDWAQAFDRQCPKLGVESFIKNGVRKTIIPVLKSYFHNRTMKFKWHKKLSTQRDPPGGGPQGASLGLLEYDSQSNDNTDIVQPGPIYSLHICNPIGKLVKVMFVMSSSLFFTNKRPFHMNTQHFCTIYPSSPSLQPL